ncbi:MAG TPA: alkaline phosphatase family protein [Candidatus Acidoferrum sp.]|nr:alkaline phosphatase family protein [Candidatus Acidoferrum sp.]
MTARNSASQLWQGARKGLAVLAMAQMSLFSPFVGSAQADDHDKDDHNRARTPIKHVIVIVGENRTFDHIFATYEPKGGESVDNLLSKHIVKEDGTPGKNFAFAYQYEADATDSATYQLAPKKKTLFSPLPAELNGGPSDVCKNNGICSLADAKSSENGLPDDYYYNFLTTGGSELTGKVPDSRINGINATAPYSTLPPGPFQLTNNTKQNPFTNDSYAESPVHRFYQMWQQFDCDASHISKQHPNGCLADLFAWTEVSVGSNVNGNAQPAGFSTQYAPGAPNTGEGATAMGFYNMAQGDAPYTKYLADHYAISDNYHQPAMGGTGLDSIMLFFGDPIWFSNPDGTPGTPPENQLVWSDTPADAGVVNEIENPNPQPGTNNYWIQDGYGGGGYGSPVYGGGSYTNCSDASQPGVAPILAYLSSLPRPIEPKCDPDHYYLLNNYNPGYFGTGANAYTDHFVYNTPFTIPPTKQRSIGDVLLENHVSWKSYNDQWNAYAIGDPTANPPVPPDIYQLNYGTVGKLSDQYCNICNGFNYQTQIMANAKIRTEHIKDTTDLYADIANGNLPAVSFVKPSGWVDGHPASSKWDLYEGFVKKIVDAVQSNKELWDSTAILITTDEGGGYYDSGYRQSLDFFGDGTRIPLIAVSKYTKPGHISHQYTDHVSVLKFIERNWNLPSVSGRSRDNLPNPKTDWDNPYVPTNTPAIGDLFDLFDFGGDYK